MPPVILLVTGGGPESDELLDRISQNIDDARVILYEQAAVMLRVTGTVLTDEGMKRVTSRNDMERLCRSQPGGDGLKVFYVEDVVIPGIEKGAGFSCKYGIVMRQSASNIALVHEIWHAFGLLDIYTSFSPDTLLAVKGPIRQEWMPLDWANGYFRQTGEGMIPQGDAIKRLVMNAESDGNVKLRIPNGRIYGLGYTERRLPWRWWSRNYYKDWELRLLKVGFEDINLNFAHE